jgi:putative transposase
MSEFAGRDGTNTVLTISQSLRSALRIRDQTEGEFLGKLNHKTWRFAMKEKRFSIEQIVAVLKQAELGMPVADLIRQVGISEQTFYRWKKQYAGMQSGQVRGFKQLQEENARLKSWLPS